jgi:hypothetical protein
MTTKPESTIPIAVLLAELAQDGPEYVPPHSAAHDLNTTQELAALPEPSPLSRAFVTALWDSAHLPRR